MQTEEQFVEEHSKVCTRERRSPANKRYCGRNVYNYLKKYKPERIDIYNCSSKERRAELIICSE